MDNWPSNWLRIKAHLVATPLEEPLLSMSRALKSLIAHKELGELRLESGRIHSVLSSRLGPESSGVDVGCHIGSFLSELQRLAPKGKHIAFEPSVAKSAWLKRKFPTAEIHGVAVGEKKGKLRFEENLSAPGFSRLVPYSHSIENARYYEVEVVKIDDVIPKSKSVNLLKLDVEGHELAAIIGARETIERNKPLLLFECGLDENLNKIETSRVLLFDFLTKELKYDIYTPVDLLYNKGPLSFDEFRKCGLFPFRALNYFGVSRN